MCKIMIILEIRYVAKEKYKRATTRVRPDLFIDKFIQIAILTSSIIGKPPIRISYQLTNN